MFVHECKGLGMLLKLETDRLSFDFFACRAKTMAGPSNLSTFPTELIFPHCLLCFTLSLEKHHHACIPSTCQSLPSFAKFGEKDASCAITRQGAFMFG